MLEVLSDPNAWATFLLLIGLELVLGIDNILIIRMKAPPVGATLRLAEAPQSL